MSIDQRVKEMVREWERLSSEGQFIPAEELCEDCPELIEEVNREITAIMARHKQLETVGYGASYRLPSETEIRSCVPALEDRPTDDSLIVTVSMFGKYRLLARGGLGEVFVADDEEFERQVALKFIRKDHDGDSEKRDQFARETLIAAKLEHPGAVPVYGMGYTTNGRPFQVMRYIRGESFESAIEKHHQDTKRDPSQLAVNFRKLLGRFVSVCQTMAYAHSRGIIHRDLKPDNVMLGKYGETLVVDWGLAKPVPLRQAHRVQDEKTLMRNIVGSAPGVSGTPHYMSPEQASGSPDLGPESDIHSLGSMLYKLLTGVRPFEADSVERILNKVRENDFPPPRSIRSEIPRSLEAICLKAMQRKPSDRYATAQEMADDIEHWLADEPVTAYDEPWYDRLRQWARYHRRLTQTMVTLLLLVIVGTTVGATMSILFTRHATVQREKRLRSEGDFRAEMLKSAIDDLKRDVKQLAGLPQVRDAADSYAQAQPTEEASKPLIAIFEAFLGLNPNYVQVRYIRHEPNATELKDRGLETVRVDRDLKASGDDPESDGEIFIPKQLLPKGDNRYFSQAMTLPLGQVYLSKININKESNVHQWDLPVIRASSPVYSKDGQKCLGVVVINMKFDAIAEKLDRPKSPDGTRAVDDDDQLVFLANKSGRFLRFPGAEMMQYSFDRGLTEYNLASLFDDLKNFEVRTREQPLFKAKAVPRRSLLIVGKSKGDADQQRLSSFVGSLYSNSEFEDLNETLVSDESEYSDLDRLAEANNDARSIALLIGDRATDTERLSQHVLNTLGNVEIYQLPKFDSRKRFAIYCRRINLVEQQSQGASEEDDFLYLLLVKPY